MPFKSFLSATAFAVATAASPMVVALPTYTATFQDTTFTFVQADADTLTFQIQNANNATGDWSGVQYLGAFSLKGIGEDFNIVTAVAHGPGATNLAGTISQLSASSVGCGAGASPLGSICFNLSPGVILTSGMMYTIDFSSPLNIATGGPHLQIVFTDTQGGSKVGSLYSQNVPLDSSSSGSGGGSSSSTGGDPSSAGGDPSSAGGDSSSIDGDPSSSDAPLPEPGTLALLGLGVALVALGRRRYMHRG